MQLTEFDYPLPAPQIASEPLAEREASRMLLVDRQAHTWRDEWFRELPELLSGGELLVVNNARVIPARLFGRREGVGAEEPGRSGRTRREYLQSTIEVLLVRHLEGARWEALVRPGRKVRVGEIIHFDADLRAEVIKRGSYGLRELSFEPAEGLEATLERVGHTPLPPYIHRNDKPTDRERYQTIFACAGVATAAPTAGLHFSQAVLARLRQRGIEISELTLEVGLGTFQPIHTERIEDHQIHREAYEIPEATAEAIRRARCEGRPVLAIGTTVVRALEDAALKFRKRYGESSGANTLEAGRDEASLYITPGHRFRVVDQLLTNFHLPRSSLLVLVAAFAGREFLLQAYGHAVKAGYRFYSYGDCMWIR